MRPKTHEQLVKQALKKPGVKKAYEDLEEEFSLLKQMLSARKKSGKTQKEVAEAMNTSTSVVGRLESSIGKNRHSPSINTLQRYARALGFHLKIKFVQSKAS